MELNPVFFYYLLYDKNNPLYNIYQNKFVIESIKTINDLKLLFNKSTLIYYLDQINDPNLNKSINYNIGTLKK